MDISTIVIPIVYANGDKLKRIKAAARKHGGVVTAERYAYNSWEGKVSIPSPWNEGREAHLARVAAIKAATL